MHWLADYSLFFAKTATWVVAILILTAGIVAILSKGKIKAKGKIVVKKLNEKYREMAHAIQEKVMPKKEYRALCKAEEKADKEHEKRKDKKRIFVIDFQGDIRASAVHNLREEVSAILSAAKPQDEVVVRLESMGGMVHTYGLAASQLARLKHHKIPLTIIVDKVAASGGYMMACVADKILAAPFAIVGSIGVLAQLPNFHRWLKHNRVDFEQFSAGEFKRTVTVFGENTDKNRQKMQEELEEVHQLFKNFITEYRPQVDIQKISTGEHWLGSHAFELRLVDELTTSDDYLLKSSQHADLLKVTYEDKKPITKRMAHFSQNILAKLGYSDYY